MWTVPALRDIPEAMIIWKGGMWEWEDFFVEHNGIWGLMKEAKLRGHEKQTTTTVSNTSASAI